MTLSIQREITAAVRPPRALYLRWPFGHPLGEAGDRNQQLHVLLAALGLFANVTEPGAIVAPDWPWRRTRFGDPFSAGAQAPHA